jgi:hypothetical protein
MYVQISGFAFKTSSVRIMWRFLIPVLSPAQHKINNNSLRNWCRRLHKYSTYHLSDQRGREFPSYDAKNLVRASPAVFSIWLCKNISHIHGPIKLSSRSETGRSLPRLLKGPGSCAFSKVTAVSKWIHWIWLLHLLQDFQCRTTYRAPVELL